MGRLILTLSAGVPLDAGHLVTYTGRKDMTIFFFIQPVVYEIWMPDLHLFKPNYSSAVHNSSAFREIFILYILSLDSCEWILNMHKYVAHCGSEALFWLVIVRNQLKEWENNFFCVIAGYFLSVFIFSLRLSISQGSLCPSSGGVDIYPSCRQRALAEWMGNGGSSRQLRGTGQMD